MPRPVKKILSMCKIIQYIINAKAVAALTVECIRLRWTCEDMGHIS